MMFIAIIVAGLHAASSTSTMQTTRMFKYHTFSFPATRDIPDNQLLVKELSSFLHHHMPNDTQPKVPVKLDATVVKLLNSTALRSANGTSLRIWPVYYDPPETQLVLKIVDMMKQAIYCTQDRLKYMDKILKRYAEDVSFRVGYIYTKLDHLLTDMRRIYTIVRRDGTVRRNWRQIMTYAHMVKKNVDITYIVEFMAAKHHKNMELLFSAT